MSLRFQFICVVGLMMFVWGAESQAWNPQVVNGRCKQTSNRCSGTIGNAGQARDACCDPASGTQATLQCEKDNTCTGGQPYKWADSQIPVKWYFNPNNMPGQSGYSGLTEQQLQTALATAWDAWSKPTCTSFRSTYVGKTTNLLSYQDNQNVVFLPTDAQWAQMGAGSSTLAFTRPVPDNSGRLLDSDIAVNPRPGGRGWSTTFLISVIAHEAGHAIGFAHTGDPRALMYFAASGSNQTLTADETTAVCFTYPKKGPCAKDEDCGGCLRCSGGNCVDKNIAPARNLCGPCTSPNDCGTTQDICIRLPEGQRCAQACDSQECCPTGYRCSEIGLGQKMCIPDAGKCPDVKCTADTNCGPGESCQSGVCKPKPVTLDPATCKDCTSDANCGGGGKCLQFDGKRRCLQTCVADNFCPTGYKCSATQVGFICLPENDFCPCSGNSDCLNGEVCRGGVCRPADCKYGCSCSEDSHCSPNHKCLQTQQGGACFQPCGGSASFPNGAPGSACVGQTCSSGAQCFQASRSDTVCLKQCSSNADCSALGGICYNIGVRVCVCQSDSDCTAGNACNKGVLGQLGGGACAPKSAGVQCETGYECKDAGGISICQPNGTGTGNKGVGEDCAAPGSCKAGLQCLQVDPNAQSGICFEECTSTNQCTQGGACIIGVQGGNSKFCGCAPQSPCATGQTCRSIGANGLGVCQGGATPPPDCGNGTCDTAKGENCSTCATDCKCTTSQKCDAGKCVENTTPSDCGNGTCDTAKGENCGTCATDCKCAAGETCTNNSCQAGTTPGCGNDKCDTGEHCGNCAADCKCENGRVCQNDKCVDPGSTTKDGGTSNNGPDANTLPCAVEDQIIGVDGKPECAQPKTGCGCDATPNVGALPLSLLLGFLALLFAARRRSF